MKSCIQEPSCLANSKSWVFVPLLLLAVSLPAFATLGGDLASVQADQAHLKGSLRITPAANYTVHEIQPVPGTLIREYVSPAGKVFAVAWKSPGHPDMRQLLGTYFEQFQRAAQGKRARHAPLLVHEPGLVVELGGHPRRFFGRAYVPEMVPEGVPVEKIR
jgi:hypothetical protein